jgi:hypothetical protein
MAKKTEKTETIRLLKFHFSEDGDGFERETVDSIAVRGNLTDKDEEIIENLYYGYFDEIPEGVWKKLELPEDPDEIEEEDIELVLKYLNARKGLSAVKIEVIDFFDPVACFGGGKE